MTKVIVNYLAAVSLLTGCSTILPRYFPPADIQPTREPLPSDVKYAQVAHGLWLDSTSPYSEETRISKDRSLLRFRGTEQETTSEKSKVVAINNILSGYFQNTESKAYRSKNAQPKLCVALSGGGVRAAGFGLGVLQGLHESGRLNNVDAISAVSGGGYILAWYLQNRIAGITEDKLFSDIYIKKKINPSLFTLSTAALGVAASPLDFMTAGSIFATGIDSPSLSSSYYGMLAGSFGASIFNRLSMAKLRTAVENGEIPLPILGISAYPLPGRLGEFGSPEDALTSHAKSVALNDTYMEVTPYRFGIQGFGFHKDMLQPLTDDLWSYVRISGAGYDRPHDIGSLKRLRGPIRLGGTMSFVASREYPSTNRVENTDQVYRHYFYATDGGFAENLAVFPLVLRRCETIVIADSEYDPEWIMEGYRVLKTRLEMEHGLELIIQGIDDLLSRHTSGVEVFTRADGLELPRTENECARAEGASPCVARNVETTIFYGSLAMIPLSMEEADAKRKTRIIYLKLGLQSNAIASDTPESVKSLMTTCMKAPDECHFPQDPTFNRAEPTESQQYSPHQFQAYKDLAQDMIRGVAW